MTKELEAWKRIKTTVERSDGDTDITNLGDLDIIETALKNEDKEKFELIKQVRELKDENASLKSFNSKLWAERQDNAKKLQALEIIKEKGWLKACLLVGDLDYYNSYVDRINETIYHGMEIYKHLTQEEYDLLKEVLYE